MTLQFMPHHFKQSADPVERLAARVARETGVRAEVAADILRGSGIDCATTNQARVIALFRTAVGVKRDERERRLAR